MSYYLADDTLSVYEPRRCNSGMPGGMFADRSKVKRHNAGPLAYYGPDQLYVGAVLVVNGRAFELMEADEFTYHHMETHPDVFSAANVDKVRSENTAGMLWDV